MGLVYTNNAQSTLASPLTAGGTTLTVATGEGTRFPTVGADDWFPLTLVRKDGTGGEIVRATGRAGDVISITRAAEGTAAITFSAGDIVSARITKEFLDTFIRNGIDSIFLKKGVNFSEGLGTVGSNVYAVSLTDISAYTDNLKITMLPHSANVAGAISINMNSLGNVPLVLPDDTVPHVGAIEDSRLVEMHYDAGLAKFVLDNAVPAAIGAATTTTLGTVIRGTETDHDISGDNAKFVTQRNASRMIKDYVDSQAENLVDPKWGNFGLGTTDLNIVANQNLVSGLAHEYDNITLSAGVVLTLTGSDTTVLRAKTAITIDGDIIINDHISEAPIGMIGPRGSNSSTPVGDPPLTAGPQAPLYGNQSAGARLKFDAFKLSIKAGTDFQSYHGGHGRGDYSNTGAGPSLDHFVYGCAGLILIAPTININASATIDCRSRVYGGAQTGIGDGGGGVIILSGHNMTVDPGSQWIAGNGTTTANPAHWSNAANYNEGPAGNAQAYTINLSNGVPSQIF